jgi:hypothetical protein
VALAGSLVFLGIFPWILKYSFRGTQVTLRRVGRAILYPVVLSLSGIGVAEVLLETLAPNKVPEQLFLSAVGFTLGSMLAMLLAPPIREEFLSLKKLLATSRFGVERDLAESPS